MRGHHVRVVATLADGTQLTDNVRTKDLGYTERAQVDAVLVPIIVTDRGRFVQRPAARGFRGAGGRRAAAARGLCERGQPAGSRARHRRERQHGEGARGREGAVKQLLSKLRPGDAATLIGFNETTFLVAEREKDQRAREDAVGLLTAWGGTALYDATVRAVDLVGRIPGAQGRGPLFGWRRPSQPHAAGSGGGSRAVGQRDAVLDRLRRRRIGPGAPCAAGAVRPVHGRPRILPRGTPRSWERSSVTSSPSCRISTCSRTCPATPAPMVRGEASGCACARASTTFARGAATRQSGPAGPER